MSMGALMRPRNSSSSILFLIFSAFFFFSLSCLVSPANGDAAQDTEALLQFKSSFLDPNALSSWNPPTPPCSGNYGNWAGVLCYEGNIWGLQLENMGLNGDLDIDALVSLPHLRTLSFMNNNFDGPVPDFKRLGALKSLYLSNNQFSGEIPDDAFAGMGSLKKLYLSNNKLSGKIPSSILTLPKLLDLRLDNNHFSGPIPDFEQKGLTSLNISNNNLEGSIPPSLVDFPPSSFSGNKNICGKPTDAACSNSPNSGNNNNNNTNSNISTLKLVIAILGIGIAILLVILIIILCIRRSKSSQSGQEEVSYDNKSRPAPVGRQKSRAVELGGGATAATGGAAVIASTSRKSDHGKLSFVRDDRKRFDLQDLLRASAEVLGSGSFGSSYKAVLMDGQAVVVKRFKQMNNVGREEFHEHMRRLGRLVHPNLLPLVAYYYRKEEKLLVFDYVPNRSLASQLHGNHSVDHPGLDWPTRLKIVKGVAKGLVYLHTELPSLNAPHGHLKSSNVLLGESFEPLLMDYTLIPVINHEHAQQIMVAYKSPDYALQRRLTKKTDVWSLGILILEILTGKIPATYVAQGVGKEEDLGGWVNSIKGAEGSNVFDKEMVNTRNSEGEMKKLLKIGLGCCEEDANKRWELKEVTEKILDLKERDIDDDDDHHHERFFSGEDLMDRV